MKTIYRDPQVEEGKHNIILQNRCGSRLTLLFHEERVELEFVYKPNAYRRKEFHARNFSNRDIQTELFKSFLLPEVRADYVKEFDYDPFVTRVKLELPNGARNTLAFVNAADENCFAISALSPLAITFKPHREFSVRDGLITEKLHDRGEEFISFVKFKGFLENRFRVLDDGTYVLQLCENDVILVGGEENQYQVKRLLKKLGDMDLDALIQYNEEKVREFTDKARLKVNNPDFQKVLDLNRRVTYSMVDQGGVTFGALQRIYFLIWIRDSLMASSMIALAGNPSLLKLVYPFVFNNPSVKKTVDGRELREYLQMVGTRWTKSEDDGLFYLVYGLYNLYKTTGDDEFLWSRHLAPVITAVDYAVSTLYDERKGLFGSDTVGETTLKSSIFYGYDAVNGSIDRWLAPNQTRKGKGVVYCYSLYHNVNMYNVLRMLEVLIKASPDMDEREGDRFGELAGRLEKAINEAFSAESDIYRAGCLVLEDGEEVWIDDFRKLDLWEYTWAVSIGPFFPDIDRAVKSGRYVMNEWRKERTYGFCPWNTLSRLMKEYGLTDREYEEMLSQEVRDALTFSERYPMVGAFTEYARSTDSWRGLPFSTGSFMHSLCSMVLQPLPVGLAVRASGFADSLENYYYKNSRINAESKGTGETVGRWAINGEEAEGSLQIPESLLRSGKNHITIERAEDYKKCRLYGSTGALLKAEKVPDGYLYSFYCPTRLQMVLENFESARGLIIQDANGNELAFENKDIENTGKTVVDTFGKGSVKVRMLL